MKYQARVIGKIDEPGPGWGLRIGVFRMENAIEEQIGEYHRNYSTLFQTFCAFQINGRDYALFSPQYHITRVMKLPECEDIGGEDPQGEGFCPTDYYVPSYIESIHGRVNQRGDEQTVTQRLYYPFGFVAGCYWGDDATWKIQYLDLSQAPQGIVKRDDRFGSIELPDKMRLRDAVDMEDYLYDGEHQQIRIAVSRRFNLETGEDLSARP